LGTEEGLRRGSGTARTDYTLALTPPSPPGEGEALATFVKGDAPGYWRSF